MSRFGDVDAASCRFSDSVDDPNDRLPPLKGYEDKPLVTIDEAIKPLESLVTDIKQMVWTIKPKCSKPQDDLSKDESAAIMLYTLEWTPTDQSFYVVLNKNLRLRDRKKLIPWFSYLRLFIHALAKLPNTTSRVIYRGVKLDMRNEYTNAEDPTWWAFSSCTSSIATLDNHIGETGNRTIFNVKFDPNSAKDIKRHSHYPEEQEVLLYPARQFKVLGILNTGNDLHIIDLEETTPEFPLFQIPRAQALNIVLIGEKNVGKSTFINAFVNYLLFPTFDQAQSRELTVLKPLSFRVSLKDTFEYRLCTFGNLSDINSVSTNQCQTYTFCLPDDDLMKVCLIDTPSFDETSQPNQIKHILDYVNRLSHINAICFLLQPDTQQLSTEFQSCFAQLMTRFSRNPQVNVMFCFTNALMSFSMPGSTAGLVRNMLRNTSMEHIQFNRGNTFFFENESFRYLIAVHNGVRFSETEKEEYTSSWIDAVKESHRFLETVRSTRTPL